MELRIEFYLSDVSGRSYWGVSTRIHGQGSTLSKKLSHLRQDSTFAEGTSPGCTLEHSDDVIQTLLADLSLLVVVVNIKAKVVYNQGQGSNLIRISNQTYFS